VSAPRSGSARLRRTLRQDQRRLTRHLARLPLADAIDVHQARVACRRLRAILKTCKPFFEDEAATAFRRELGQIADLAAEIRELDVIAALPGLRQEPVAGVLRAQRVAAVRRLRRRLSSASTRLRVEAVLSGRAGARVGLLPAVPAGALLRRARRTWRRAEPLVTTPPRDPATLHDLRIRLKNCRYTIELIEDLAATRNTVLRRRLRDAQQLLGDLRDTGAALEWLAASPLPVSARRRAAARLRAANRRRTRRLRPVLRRLADAGQQWDRAATRLLERE
jgi:CHAD domain-containing protein